MADRRALYHEGGCVFLVEVLSDEGSVTLSEHEGRPMRRVRLRCVRTVHTPRSSGDEWTATSNVDYPEHAPWRLEYAEGSEW